MLEAHLYKKFISLIAALGFTWVHHNWKTITWSQWPISPSLLLPEAPPSRTVTTQVYTLENFQPYNQ